MIVLKDVNVEFKLKGNLVRAVNNVNLTINKGEVFGIVGLSGAGKSTLVRVINLLQKPSSGQVFINGKDITKLNRTELRKTRLKIGMIFQHFNLIGGKTIYENIEFVLKANNYAKEKRRDRIYELLELVNLKDKADVYPSNLSGGQKQRVGIARAIANNPEILLCDEATSALDLENTEEILKLLKNIKDKTGITIVFITHEMEVAKKLFNRVAVMSNGEIVEVHDIYSIFSDPKHEVTKSLISRNFNLDLPKEIIKSINEGEIIKVYYKGDNSLKPIISEAAKNFDVDISIIHGKIDYINGRPIGILIVNITGNKDEIAKAKIYIKENVIKTERIVNEYLEVI
ncbi:methionine ABC transporter ATP-binding protein [Clostridium saccharoperbutylacetonicum]|uniref:methionine ABC transporter ATP-binding protein n=1 Tax=Clostridium saccharoperbutylacetonicum TaxID=36745 RepID=UPI00156F860A|nr:ATP-binding cassette domain-containing protein [Clostridium saccharoperbutylacetonicum]NSB30247.1 D-methionine transport system ATP-binding protein [Clostridium saccharoperbutylacetonicum]